MKIEGKELVALAIENKLQEYNSSMILFPERGIKIKDLFRFMGLVSFNITDQQISKKEIFKHWKSLLVHNPLTLFRIICYPIVNLILILLNLFSSICNLFGKIIIATTCLMPIIYWLAQKSSDNDKMSVTELFNSYGSFLVGTMIIIIIAQRMYLMIVTPVEGNKKRTNDFYKNLFLTPFKPIDLIHMTIWFQSAEGKIVAADYNVDRDYYKLQLSKEDIVHLLIQDKLTLDELSMYYNTLTSVDSFFLVDGFARQAKQQKDDYIEKLKIKRLAKSVYMKRKGVKEI